MALPSRYTQLRYIQSSGTQWIDTGFVPTAKTKIEFDFEYTNLTAQYSGLFVSGSWFMYGINGNHEIYLGTQYAIGDTATKDRTLVTIDGVNKVATIGNKSYSFSEASFTKPSVTLPIFVLNDGSAKRNYCYMKLYSYKIYDDGTLIRNFVPALRHDSYGSLAGLYDLVNNVFYTNAGSGSFSYDLATGAVDGVGASIIDAASYGITEGKCMAGGTVYSIKKGRTLVGGTGYDIYFASGILASDIAVGSSVFLNINGTPIEFLVVNRGIPNESLVYDSSCDGLWLLMKDVYMPSQWHSSRRNEYAASIAHSFLNGNFLNNFDTAANEAIKTVKIPYWNGTGTAGADKIGANGLTAKVFLLSMREIGLGSMSSVACPKSRVLLDYFINGDSTEAKAKRIAYSDGKASEWWTRDPKTDTTNIVWRVGTDGSNGSYYSNLSYGLRPAMILSYDAIFDEETLICKGLA